MNHALSSLGRNFVAGLRLALFLRVTRLAFRIDLGQLLLLFVASAAIDVATDWVRSGPDAWFSWFGTGGELFAMGILLLSAAAQALLFRQRTLALAIPVLALAAYPVVQIVHVVPHAISSFGDGAASSFADALEWALAVWSVAVLVRSVAVALVPSRPHYIFRALAGGLMLAVPIALCARPHADHLLVAVRPGIRRRPLPEPRFRAGARGAADAARRCAVEPR